MWCETTCSVEAVASWWRLAEVDVVKNVIRMFKLLDHTHFIRIQTETAAKRQKVSNSQLIFDNDIHNWCWYSQLMMMFTTDADIYSWWFRAEDLHKYSEMTHLLSHSKRIYILKLKIKNQKADLIQEKCAVLSLFDRDFTMNDHRNLLRMH